MTTFSITGERAGEQDITITWTDGELSGDPGTVALLKRFAAGLDGTLQGQPGGPYTTHDHLASPYTARALMKRMFRRGTTTQEGHLPLLPPVPDGAIR